MDFLRGPDDPKADAALRRVDQPSPGFILEAEPDELAGAVDVAALLVEVCRETGDDLATIQAALTRSPCRIKVMVGSDMASLAEAVGLATGLSGAACARGLYLPPRLIVVCRLDWRSLLGHELTHLVDYLAGRSKSEARAEAVADAMH